MCSFDSESFLFVKLVPVCLVFITGNTVERRYKSGLFKKLVRIFPLVIFLNEKESHLRRGTRVSI